MKKISLLCVSIVALILMGCRGNATFDFDEFVNQYPTQIATEEIWGIPEEGTTVEEGSSILGTETLVLGAAKEILYSNTVKIQFGEDEVFEDICVTGDVIAYLVRHPEEDRIYLTSASTGGDKLIFSTENEICNMACDEGQIVWRQYNKEESTYETYLYKDGEITGCKKLKNIKDIDEIDVDGDYILFFNEWKHRYTYDMVRDELTEIPVEESKCLYDYNIIWDYEDGYGGFTCEANHIKIKDVFGNVVYETQLENAAFLYEGNRNMIALKNYSEGNVFVDCLDGDDYSINYQVDEVVVTGDWVFMSNGIREQIRVFNPHYPGLIWKMDSKEIVGAMYEADEGQVMFYSWDDTSATVTVYTMK